MSVSPAPEMSKNPSTGNPEIGRSIAAAGIRTNYHDAGIGAPVMLLHGSGPGVSAWANWRLVLPALAQRCRVIAPDLVGFGFSDRPPDFRYTLDNWVAHAVGLLDALELKQVDLVGNSFRSERARPGRVRFQRSSAGFSLHARQLGGSCRGPTRCTGIEAGRSGRQFLRGRSRARAGDMSSAARAAAGADG